MLRELVLHFQQTLIIGARHFNVDVIVPRDKAVIADRAKQRSSVHIISEPVLFADPIQLQQQFQLDLLHLF